MMSGQQISRQDVKVVGATYAQVAVDQALDAVLTYHIPQDLVPVAVAGARVTVPLGRGDRPVAGVLLEAGTMANMAVSAENSGHTTASILGEDNGLLWPSNTERQSRKLRLKDILMVHTEVAVVPQDILALARWISRYYCAPLGLVLSTIVPAGVKTNARLPKQRLVTVGPSWVAVDGGTLPGTGRILRRDRELLERLIPWLEQQPRTDTAVLEYAGISVVTLKRLAQRGFLAIKQQMLLPDEGTADGRHDQEALSAVGAAMNSERRLILSSEQQAVLANLQPLLERPTFAVRLIQGVTGSGKTEVYLRAAEQVVAAGRRVIVLVPEIALTPQTVQRFTSRFDRVAIMHSGLTDSQRHQHWRAIANGWAQVIVGVRSAIFAPATNLGLIVVDEEHDSSYKQDSTPRYNGRDVAVRRGQMLNIPVILGSATPSLESWQNSQTNPHYTLLQLTSRPLGTAMPRVVRVDMKVDRRQRPGLHILSMVLEHQIKETLGEKGQVILLLNRRGYAHYVACARCDWVLLCDNCDATMVVHRLDETGASVSGESSVVRCHYCLTSRLLPKTCPQCQSKVVSLGQGTQRAEDEVKRKFPQARLLRMDSDTMRQGRDYQRVLAEFGAGEVDILLGTQMIAKGLDFPNVRLVGVLNADLAMSTPDFRAAERTFDLICQVAGRSGRAHQQGTVVVQSFGPDEPAIAYAAQHDYAGFIGQELPHRQALGYPPYGRMVRFVASDKSHDLAQGQAALLAGHIERVLQQLKLKDAVRVAGPQAAPLARVAEEFRWEILLFSRAATHVQQVLAVLREQKVFASLKVALVIDVDPLQMQ